MLCFVLLIDCKVPFPSCVLVHELCPCVYLGNVINIQTGQWTGRMSGLGAGIDSFYEYLLKVYTHMSDYTTPLAWKYILGEGVEKGGCGECEARGARGSDFNMLQT